MSFYLAIHTPTRVSYNDIVTKLTTKNVETSFVDDPKSIVSDNLTKLFVPGQSTRGVTLKYTDNAYSIGLNVVASEPDYHLALETAQVIAALTQSLILPEDTETAVDAETLTKTYNQAWIDSIKTLGIEIFIDRIGKGNESLDIGCCYMTYSVGPRVHSLLDSSSEMAYYNSLVRHITQTQFWDRSNYATPSLLQVKEPGSDKPIRIVVFYPTGNQFIPNADKVIMKQGEELVKVPFALLPQLATDKFQLIDESQYLLDALTAEEYNQLFEHAKKLVNTPAPVEKARSQKKWWKFW